MQRQHKHLYSEDWSIELDMCYFAHNHYTTKKIDRKQLGFLLSPRLCDTNPKESIVFNCNGTTIMQLYFIFYSG